MTTLIKNQRMTAYRNIIFSFAAIVLCLLMGGCNTAPTRSMASTETIIAIRHGEKPPDSLGQLDCKGLNRALALPSILLTRYGHPDSIFAPNPSVMTTSRNGTYSYVRPLATIEPTAIQAHLPVNTQIGLNNIERLEQEVTSPSYGNGVVYIAWEHKYLDDFARELVATYGGNPAQVPPWPEEDYDSIFIIRLRVQNGRRSVAFQHEHEDLTGRLSDICPTPLLNGNAKQIH